ncbi:unnamed protein product (macronuclear) [Paramecium tetraurelia]|uniref:EGF-like domain-containing protein n=1 Tax=Paramecium tetraurelia TaxID=5888 RepID=A0CTR7_PARTE|nr:uncharacterized protein GSPATT00010418001 [Paramecium tetraurelia]CAK74184.1 unnamed protein product [Paramecium tetraurelia]|eukprot:XP_001441581.1 hypothetical protein (macronuclear) [Paramecium tetraurelia strain d4-2]
MTISIIQILFALLVISKSQWHSKTQLLYYDKIFTSTPDRYNEFWQYWHFTLSSGSTPANFIDCTTPTTSYITLNNAQATAKYNESCTYDVGDYVSIDLFFHGTWLSQNVQFTIGTFSKTYTYTSPANYPMTTGFCNTIPFEVKTWKFAIPSLQSGYPQFKSLNTNSGQVSIRNFVTSSIFFICYPSCSDCTGPQFNQCTSCYEGTLINNICPSCPSNQYYEKYSGCKDICDIDQSFYSNGFCNRFTNRIIESAQIGNRYSDLQWFELYDPQNIDTSPKLILIKYLFGIFKFNSGFYRFFPQYPLLYWISLILDLKLQLLHLMTFQLIVELRSIYKNVSGIQTHKFKIYQTQLSSSYLTYSSSKTYVLITYFNIPKYPFLFSATGNYTDNTAGWAIQKIEITSGFCHEDCVFCEVSFKCKTCKSGYYFYRDGRCIEDCISPYQRLSGYYCYDYADETPYSQYLVQEYLDLAGDPEQYAKYTLISQNGLNFLRGSDIYYSYWQGFRVFGGPFVWAQAKFQRVHNIINPHHSVTIAFYILYGPSFPSDGKFIYTIESDTPVTKSTAEYYLSDYDGTKQDKVYERVKHNANTLTITWECFGPNNEPIKAYCAYYNYYIAVHNCQPYCLQCSDQSTCTQWNSTYDSNIVQFSQAECQSDQYYDKESIRCLTCPSSCLTCTSQLDCQTCQPTYTQSKLGCFCKVNQYEDSNQCYNCPIECNQCLSSTYCIECLTTNNRKLSNAQCNCIDGYYPIISDPKCQLCHQFCKTCTGPTSDDCLTCNDIPNIEKVGSTCRCPTGMSYQFATQTCSSCHSSCLTCFRTTIDGCLTCNSTLNRLLKGLKCVCAPGYYELSNVCTNCPTTEDPSLSECYKLCNNNQLIWHTITCSSCDTGFQLVSGECQPICGDLQIKGYEQCEDNNTILNDLCYNCQFQCPAYCVTCDSSTTLPCPDVCGDGIITGIEECEDGNTIEYDGCFNCKYQCQPACTMCIKGQCFECATGGWYIDPLITPWQCKEKCGDGLIIGSEQCEDGNTSDTDGCKDCKYFCRIGCSSCDYTTNTCLSCALPGFVPKSYYCQNVCGDGLAVVDPSGVNSEQCDDGNKLSYDGCSSSCQFQCQSITICINCVNNRCEECATGYYLSDKKICIPICGDALIVVGEQCENSSILPYKGCNNCQARCQPSCLTCSTTGLGCLQIIDNLCYSICGDKTITQDEQCDDGNFIIGDGCHLCQFSCQDSCLYCLQGICYNCQEGYQLIQSKCYSICGDGLQKNNEQCDQQIKIQDSIKLNQNCDVNCISCLEGICGLCSQGNYLFKNQCNSNHITVIFVGNDDLNVCGDSKIMDNEECEDNNLNPFDGCYNCECQCDINCVDWLIWKLQGMFSWFFKCGDGIVVPFSNEQCDDDNEGCINCQFKCKPYCSKCDLQYCIQCQIGLLPLDNFCISICGDGIVINEYEECDDSNELPFDGCYECKFQCTLHCQICNKGECLKCNNDYALSNNKCLLNTEQDDLNSFNNNTSYGQNPEWLSLNDDMICRGYECVYSKKPRMKLTYKTQSFALQYVEITFDQEVKFIDEVQKDKNLFNISIKDLDSQYYNIKINSIQDISFDLQHAQYQVQVELFLQLQTKPVLLVQLNQEIINGNNQTLFNSNQSITLQTPKIMSEQLKQVSNYAQQSNKAFMIGAILICIISLVSGESSFVVETLNLLQYQSFLRFINVEYPENLYIYFQAQELLSISSYLQLFQIDDYLNLITRKEKQIDLNGKFQQYNVEADLFTNILPQLIQFLVLVTLLYFAENLYNILFRLIKYLRHLKHQKTLLSKILLQMINLLLIFKNASNL